MSAATEARLWYAQRISAMVLALCVTVHLATLVYATHEGLTAAAILGRTQGSILAGSFYALFVIAYAIHVPIGLARVFEEWLRWRGRVMWVATLMIGAVTLGLGLCAVYAVVIK